MTFWNKTLQDNDILEWTKLQDKKLDSNNIRNKKLTMAFQNKVLKKIRKITFRKKNPSGIMMFWNKQIFRVFWSKNFMIMTFWINKFQDENADWYNDLP